MRWRGGKEETKKQGRYIELDIFNDQIWHLKMFYFIGVITGNCTGNVYRKLDAKISQ